MAFSRTGVGNVPASERPAGASRQVPPAGGRIRTRAVVDGRMQLCRYGFVRDGRGALFRNAPASGDAGGGDRLPRRRRRDRSCRGGGGPAVSPLPRAVRAAAAVITFRT